MAFIVRFRISQIQKNVPRFVSELLRHDFPGQKLNVWLGEHKQNFGGGSYFDAFSDPPVLLSWEEGKYWKPFSRSGNNFNLQPWIEWSYLRQDSELLYGATSAH